MQPLDNVFFEAYKRLDRLCSDMYSCSNGISHYIEDMESQSTYGRAAITEWDQFYKELKLMILLHIKSAQNRTSKMSPIPMKIFCMGQTLLRNYVDIKNADSQAPGGPLSHHHFLITTPQSPDTQTESITVPCLSLC